MRMCHLNVLWTLDPGVLRKLSHQAKALQKVIGAGNQADCIVVARPEALQDLEVDPVLSIFPITAPGPSIIKEAMLPFLVWSKLEDRLSQYDAIVARWPIPTRSFLKSVQDHPIFTEHHSKELEEIAHAQGVKSLVRRSWERKYSPQILRSAKGIIGVTDEIRRYELKRAGANRPSLVLPNGISLNDISLTPPAKFDGPSLDIAFISSQFLPWHGLDRLLQGMRLWNNSNLNLKIHLIGNVTSEQKIDIESKGLSQFVTIHGVLYGEDLNKILNSCHLAVGSLALHRNQLKEACVLKVREYTARGLPFVIGYDDPDFPDDLPWLLKIPADDSPVDIHALVDFAREVHKRSSLAEEMREFALTRLSWEAKMKWLVDFVRENI